MLRWPLAARMARAHRALLHAPVPRVRGESVCDPIASDPDRAAKSVRLSHSFAHACATPESPSAQPTREPRLRSERDPPQCAPIATPLHKALDASSLRPPSPNILR